MTSESCPRMYPHCILQCKALAAKLFSIRASSEKISYVLCYPKDNTSPAQGPHHPCARLHSHRLWWRNSGQQLNTHPVTRSLSPTCPAVCGRESEQQKRKKLVGWDWDSWICEERGKISKQVMQRQSLPTSHKQTNAQSVPDQALPWEDPPFPPTLMLSMTLSSKEYSLGQFESAVRLCLLQPLGHP